MQIGLFCGNICSKANNVKIHANKGMKTQEHTAFCLSMKFVKLDEVDSPA